MRPFIVDRDELALFLGKEAQKAIDIVMCNASLSAEER
jgi:hypothetical protein